MASMLLRALARAGRALDLPGRSVLVAMSGGVDSTVLLHGLHALREPLGLKLSVGHVNHGLRPDAEQDVEAVRAHARALDLPIALERVEPGRLRRGRASQARPTLQEASRRARYDALHRMAAELGAERIATAHTLDDQAETVLLRLLRGSGPEGLAGIPERSPDGRVVRPLLGVSRAEVLAFARARRIAWREDPSNASPRFARSRLRTQWLPGLAAAFNPRLLRAVADLAEAQRRELEWLERLVDREAEARFVEEGDTLRIDVKDWEALPEALQRRLARRALRRCGGGRDVSRTHLLRVSAFLRHGRPGGRLELPGGRWLVREKGGFRLGPRVLLGSPGC